MPKSCNDLLCIFSIECLEYSNNTNCNNLSGILALSLFITNETSGIPIKSFIPLIMLNPIPNSIFNLLLNASNTSDTSIFSCTNKEFF